MRKARGLDSGGAAQHVRPAPAPATAASGAPSLGRAWKVDSHSRSRGRPEG
ncbi:MAG TPA: hypothetical protein VHR45_07400 [Thermoanaerobaculia bacterium]|nr:hypothetical protein [Thermoanaerobaculia bacterium]